MPELNRELKLSHRWSTKLPDFITSLHVSQSASWLVAGCGNGSLHVCSTNSGNILWSHSAHQVGVNAVAISNEIEGGIPIVVSGGQDGHLRFWRLSDGGLISEHKQKSFSVDHISVSPDRRFVAAAAGKNLSLYQGGGELLKAFNPSGASISGLAWTPKTRKIVTTCYGGVYLWQVENDEPEETLSWKGSTIGLRLSPTADWIACGTQDLGVHIWNTRTKQDLEMSGYPFKVKDLAWSPDGRFLATGGGEQVTIWDFSGKGPAGSTPASMDSHEDLVTGLVFHPTKPFLLSSDRSGRICISNSKSFKTLTLALFPEEVVSVAWTGNEGAFVVAGADGTLAQFEVATL